MKNEKVRILCEGAICVALSCALNFLELNLWYQGGSIGLTMLPLVVFAWRRGTGWGVLAGLVFGTIKCTFDGGLSWGWQSILLDYVVAYAAVGLAGLTRRLPRYALPSGALVGGAIRFVVHFISGITIYKILAPTELFGVTYTNPWMYSLAYNLGYMLPSTILVALLGLLLQSRLEKIKK